MGQTCPHGCSRLLPLHVLSHLLHGRLVAISDSQDSDLLSASTKQPRSTSEANVIWKQTSLKTKFKGDS